MNSDSTDSLKNELIIIIMDKIYKDDPDNYEKNLEYLTSLSLKEIDKILSDYYLYNIKKYN